MTKTAIIVLNYNNLQDTKNCIISLLQLEIQTYDIIVIDNQSTDDSGILLLEFTNSLNKHNLYFFQNSINNGYAGGNNFGINKAKTLFKYDYFWILNNDTLVYPNTLNELVKFSELNPDYKIIGNTIVFFDNQNIVQSFGAGFNYWFAQGYNLSEFSEIDQFKNSEIDFNKIKYPVGASIFVKNEYLEIVGLMHEQYFLYYEEIDWIERGKKKFQNFMGFCKSAIVIHKEGASIGTYKTIKSDISDFFYVRNRLIFTLRNKKQYLPSVLLGIFITLLNRLRKGQISRVKMIIKILLRPYNNPYLK